MKFGEMAPAIYHFPGHTAGGVRYSRRATHLFGEPNARQLMRLPS